MFSGEHAFIIDLGFAHDITEDTFPFAGAVRTASDSVLDQLDKNSLGIHYRTNDDFISLVKVRMSAPIILVVLQFMLPFTQVPIPPSQSRDDEETARPKRICGPRDLLVQNSRRLEDSH